VIVDVHAHHVPPAFVRRLGAGGAWGVAAEPEGDGDWRVSVNGRRARQPLRARLLDLERRLADMDESGVDVQVVSCWAALTDYAVPVRAAAGYARAFNDELAAAVAVAPDRLRGLAIVPLQAPEAAAAELARAVEELGLVGAEILTRVGERELDDPALDPFWGAAEALGCLLFVHPHDSLAGRRLERHRIDNLVGNPAETTIALAHLVLGGVLERFPRLRICAAHAGGYLPYAAGRLDHGHRAMGDRIGPALSRSPGEWLRALHYDTVAHSAAALRFLLDFAGAERVLLGSDFPFPMGDRDPVATVLGVPRLTAGERNAVLGETAARLGLVPQTISKQNG
jgi:aminocarboxymuconate-semialdehyde decarboxylase